MSIINEALKKTEEHLQKNTARVIPLPSKPVRAKPVILYLLILLAGLLLGNFVFNLLRHQIQTTQTIKKNVLPVVQTTVLPPAPVLPVVPIPEKKPRDVNFILNGIFYSDNDGYALVNNQIVRENDYVDGAKVGLITTNSVELDYAGEKIMLTSSR